MQYRREVDGLRALAVVPVVLFHAGFQTFSGGFVGVDVFFVISGFLITSIILGEMQAGTFTLAGFYERRARRILPALFFVMLACLPFAWFWLLPSDMKEFSDSVLAVTAFASNIFFWKTSGYFETATELKPLLHTWSLAVEEQYYLLFPLFLIAVWRLGTRWIAAILVVIAGGSLAAAQWGSVNSPDASFYLLPTRAWELLLGALVAIYLAGPAQGRQRTRMHEAGAAIGLSLIVYSIFALDKYTPFPSVHTLLPTVGAVLVILFATDDTIVGRLLGSRPAVGIGLVSYSAYLWHQPLFAFAKHRVGAEPPAVLMGALAAGCLALAYLSWRFVETPFRSRRVFTRGQIFRLGAAGSVVFLALGAAGSLSTGFAFRYDAQDRFLATLQKREAGAFVERRFNERLMKAFDPADSRRKVLILGDSFAQDLVNVVHEGGMGEGLQISTRHISHRCGNLFLARGSFAERIADGDRSRCGTSGIYEDAALRKLMQAADEIWFASRWQSWQAELVSGSVANVVGTFHKPVRVFGTKEVGDVDIKVLLAMPPPVRLASQGTVSRDTLEINAVLRRTLGEGIYVDLQALLCGANAAKCGLFASDGVLLSYDGRHLTQPGAQYLGEKLSASLLPGRQ
jgi:peptidoglycan/LPS O-acetylase OafA/YrhL